MKRNILTYAIVFAIVLTACEEGDHLNADVIPQMVDTTTPFDTESLISPRELFTDVEYIQLGSPDEFFLTQAKKIAELDNRLFILDKNKKIVVAYDIEGNFLGRVGEKGMGPEEYQVATDFVVDPKRNSVFIFSRADHAILEFGSDLSFKRKIRIEKWAFQISLLESGNIALYTFFDEGSSNVLIYDLEGNEVGEKMPFPKDGAYTPMDYSGFIEGNYYTYPLSSKIVKLEEGETEDSQIFEVNFPSKRPEDKMFDHKEFLGGPNWMKEHVLCKFSVGQDANELLFYYSFNEGGNQGFTFGVKLESGQVFGHRNLKHGIKSRSDQFVKLFLLGPYNLPVYSQGSGYYYTATTNEFMDEFFSVDKEAALEELKGIDSELYEILSTAKDTENPLLMRFKLRKSYE